MCASRLLGMGGDSLLMHLCGNLLEVGHRQKGGGIQGVDRLLLPAYMGGCLSICKTYLSCELSEGVSHYFSGPRMIGLIEWLCLLAFFWCSKVLVLWGLVLLYEMGVECEGRFEMAAGCHCRNWT